MRKMKICDKQKIKKALYASTSVNTATKRYMTRLGITKAGNSHLRTLLIEAAQSFSRGQIGYKSKALRARQQGCSSAVIAYADKANERLRRLYYKLTLTKGKKMNVAKTAIARELACYIWGMMTENIA